LPTTTHVKTPPFSALVIKACMGDLMKEGLYTLRVAGRDRRFEHLTRKSQAFASREASDFAPHFN